MKRALAVVAGAVLGVGCTTYSGYDYAAADQTGGFTDSQSTRFQAVGGQMRGRLGDAPEVNGPATEIQLLDYADWYGGGSEMLETTVFADSTNGSTMVRLSLPGTPGEGNLAVGQQTNSADPNAIPVSVVGCSGAERGSWDFDAPADETETRILSVPAEPDVIRVEFAARWRENGRVVNEVRGNVDLRRTTPVQGSVWAFVKGASVMGDVGALLDVRDQTALANVTVTGGNTTVRHQVSASNGAGEIELTLNGEANTWATGVRTLRAGEATGAVRSGAVKGVWDLQGTVDEVELEVSDVDGMRWLRTTVRSTVDGNAQVVTTMVGVQFAQ